MILIIDDDESLLEFYKDIFIYLGYETVTFSNPILALEFFDQNPYTCDLVIKCQK